MMCFGWIIHNIYSVIITSYHLRHTSSIQENYIENYFFLEVTSR